MVKILLAGSALTVKLKTNDVAITQVVRKDLFTADLPWDCNRGCNQDYLNCLFFTAHFLRLVLLTKSALCMLGKTQKRFAMALVTGATVLITQKLVKVF